jgi:hypothetical protein
MIGRMTRNLAAYVRHAEQYGGLRDCWEAAADELGAVALGELAAALRGLAARQRRIGRKGRTVNVETFRLGRDETAVLIGRLIEAGVGDADVCRYTASTRAVVAAIRAEVGLDPHQPAGQERTDRADSRYKVASAMDRSSRRCEWCSRPLTATSRTDARYCAGGACRVAAHRARQAPAGSDLRVHDRSRPSGYDGGT